MWWKSRANWKKSESRFKISNSRRGGAFMTIPQLSPEKRREALEKAQMMRKERAAVREKLKAGEMTIQEALESTSEVISKMRVSYLLESLPQIGKITAAKIMEEIGISANRRVQGLGERQKKALLERVK
jgi:hypothetical protein